MRRTLRKNGNSYGLTIERPLMDLLGITPESQLDVAVEDGALIVRPVKRATDRKDFIRQELKEVNAVHHEALRKLAD